MKLAIVGGGPRCVFALEALCDVPGRTPEVTVFEPRPQLGSGMAYGPEQPDYYRLNVAAGSVLSESILGISFVDWLAVTHPEHAGEPYPPRARVGQFLAECARAASSRMSLRHVRERVRELIHREAGWIVRTDTGEAVFDAVLVVVGHDHEWTGRLPRATGIPPYGSELTQRPGRLETVAVRGAALTAIDATLDCTEGRGGAFVASTRRPGALEYRPGALDARSVTWVSRSGRLMSAKTELEPELRERVTTAVVPLLPLDAQMPTSELLERAAAAIGTTVGAQNRARPPDGSRAWLEFDIRVARGVVPPDGYWARAQAWRSLYPALVERHLVWQTSGGQPAEGWAAFGELAAQLERQAFGPPLLNAEKCLALMDAGVLRVSAGERPSAELSIDAVLAPPGIVSSTESLWERLRSHGEIETASGGRRGIAIDTDGTALVDGQRVEGLAILGRATEDVVLGNDTLNRALHPHLGRWAQQLTAMTEVTG